MTALIKAFAQWLMYGGLIVAAIAILLLGKADRDAVEDLRLQVSGAVAPILEVLGSPVDAVAKGLETIDQWRAVGRENARLRAENSQLQQWQALAEQLESENIELKQLLNYVPDPSAHFVTARVVADHGGAFAESLLINAGSQHSVARGQVVTNNEGLVGRVIGVAPRAARVLLLTDLNSRVPVFVGHARVRAILAGDNTDRPKLIHIEPGSPITAGDRVVTSAITRSFPPGLPVGVVAETDGLEISVAPLFERSRLEYVRVVAYALSPMLEEGGPSRTGSPPLRGRAGSGRSGSAAGPLEE